MPAASVNTPQPIEPYVQILQSKSTTAFVRNMLLKALSDPRVYVGFSELRCIPTVVDALQESDSGIALLDTLDLFSYGTIKDYVSSPKGKYISLTPTLLAKLKALTVVTVVQKWCEVDPSQSRTSTRVSSATDGTSYSNRRRRRVKYQSPSHDVSCRIIPYSVFEAELDMLQEVANVDCQNKREKNIRHLEDLLIHCIYANLLPPGSKLNQQIMSLVINLSSQSQSSVASKSESNHVLCRDVNVESDISDMISKLEAFYEKGKENIFTLSKSLEKLNQDTSKGTEKWRRVNKSINEMKEKVEHNSEPRIGNNSMRMMTEGESGGIAMSMSSLSASGRSRQVKRSRGGIGGAIGRI